MDEEEVEDSRTEGSPCCWRELSSSGVLCLVTGGRLCSGLDCFVREVLLEKVAPGEYEDIDVGVDEMLKGPGDSEYRVEGVVDSAY